VELDGDELATFDEIAAAVGTSRDSARRMTMLALVKVRKRAPLLRLYLSGNQDAWRSAASGVLSRDGSRQR
jgi:hypothetical protein